MRPLAWLHCFANVNHKDLLAFIERYGMPFLVAKVDDNEFDTQKNKLRKLIRNFGSGGGGLFTKAVELEMLQAAQTTGDVYFRLLEYLGDAVNRIVLGQTASSGDSSGLSGGDAQSQVRQDILCSDARWLERGISAQIFKVWGEYNFPGIQPPRLKIQTEPAEDLAALATTVSSLYAGGLETDPAEMSERFGIKLTRRPEPAAPPMGGAFPMADAAPQDKRKTELADALEEWLGPMADGIERAAGLDDDKLDALLRSGEITKPGSSTRFEDLMRNEMERPFRENPVSGK